MQTKNKSAMNIDWIITPGLVDYETAVATMEARVEDIIQGKAAEAVWLLEHPPLYTAGTSAVDSDILHSTDFPVYQTGRGGKYTYHGPGQRVVYVMLDLKKRGQMDLRKFVYKLEAWIIAALKKLDIEATANPERIGLWVKDQHNIEAKIAAIGVRVRQWVTFHGAAINLNPDLSHFNAIIPCGIHDLGVTSIYQLGKKIGMQTLDQALMDTFKDVMDQ